MIHISYGLIHENNAVPTVHKFCRSYVRLIYWTFSILRIIMAPPAAKPRIVASPTLRSTPSLSNIYIHGHHSPFASMTNLVATPPVLATQPQNSINSSASSVSNLDTSEGILIQETEVEVDTNEEEALGSIDHPAGDDASKKTLRDKLRRTLSENSGEPDFGFRNHFSMSQDMQRHNINAHPTKGSGIGCQRSTA
jgi:hypothetical protein